ncbi:MAG: hypothetical protein QM688_07180 [Sphingomonas bacterium]
MPLSIAASLLLTVAGSALLYAGARNQRLIVAGEGRPVLRWSGAAMLLCSLLLMLGWFGPATAVFVWMTLAMFVWTLLPLGAAWWRRPREGAE